MKRIPLTKGKFATVDDKDFNYMSQWHWCAKRVKRAFYAARNTTLCPGVYKTLFMHREILKAIIGMEVDHIDGDGLNNRRENLRAITPKQNRQAGRKKRIGCASKFRGVSWYKRIKKWQAAICVDGKDHHLGYFNSERGAAQAYDKKSKQLLGRFASPNFKPCP